MTNTLANPPDTKEMVVYCLTSPSGKRYVGVSTRSFICRAREHLKSAKYASEKAVHRAIRKYGPDRIVVTILAEGVGSENELYSLEREYVEQLKSYGLTGYNMTLGGEGSSGFFDALSDDVKIRVSSESRDRMLSLWANPAMRDRLLAGSRTMASSSEHKEAARQRILKLNSDPEFCDIRNKTLAKARMTAKWRENFNAAIVKRSENQEWVESQAKRLRSYYNNPDNKAKSLERLAKMNLDPEFQKRRIESCRKSWANPELIKQQADRNKSKAKIKDSDYYQITDLYSYGFTGKEISKMYGVNSHQTIYNILNKLGFKKSVSGVKP